MLKCHGTKYNSPNYRWEMLQKEKAEALSELQEKIASLETQKSFQAQKYKVISVLKHFFSSDLQGSALISKRKVGSRH